VRRTAVAGAVGSLRGVRGAGRFRRDLAGVAREAARRRRGSVELSVAVVSDREMRRLHRVHSGLDSTTDVLSFPLSSPRDRVLVGAIAVSRDTARREAARRGHAAYHELMLYVVHGALHILGHDDHEPRARARMRRAEREVLASLGLPAVFGPDGADHREAP
jgi:probable rRNA maturation factor